MTYTNNSIGVLQVIPIYLGVTSDESKKVHGDKSSRLNHFSQNQPRKRDEIRHLLKASKLGDFDELGLLLATMLLDHVNATFFLHRSPLILNEWYGCIENMRTPNYKSFCAQIKSGHTLLLWVIKLFTISCPFWVTQMKSLSFLKGPIHLSQPHHLVQIQHQQSLRYASSPPRTRL